MFGKSGLDLKLSLFSSKKRTQELKKNKLKELIEHNQNILVLKQIFLSGQINTYTPEASQSVRNQHPITEQDNPEYRASYTTIENQSLNGETLQ